MFLTNLFSNPILLIAFFIALILAITVHEYAHAWAAYRSGDSTAKYMGRLSLNPLVHLDPLGTLFLLLVGFGWGKPVPVNPNNLKSKDDEIKVALAGIFANIIFAFLLGIPIRLAIMNGTPIESSLVLQFINFVLEINLILAAFNLLPIYPLDGSHLIEYFLDDQAKENYRAYGPYLLLGLIVFGRISGTSIISIVMEPVLRVLSFIVKGTISTF